MEYFDIVCLANSRKLNGHCIAGKHPQGKSWIRPVSPQTSTGELSSSQVRCACGNEVKLLDIVRIPKGTSKASIYHPEDISINSGRWSKIGRFALKNLHLLCDIPENLWLSGGGQRDRIPFNEIEQTGVSGSLVLIRASNIKFHTCFSSNDRRQLRASFVYRGRNYNFVVTDYQYERVYHQKEIGEYDLSNFHFYLCISLGVPFHGYCYKLIASVICYETYPKVAEENSVIQQNYSKESSSLGAASNNIAKAASAGNVLEKSTTTCRSCAYYSSCLDSFGTFESRCEKYVLSVGFRNF